jgi:hypothetical protein
VLAQGAGALQAGNTVGKGLLLAFLLGNGERPEPAAVPHAVARPRAASRFLPGAAAAGAWAPDARPGLVPDERPFSSPADPAPEAEPAPPAPSGSPAAPDSGADPLIAALRHYESLTYPQQWVSWQDGSPVRLGTRIPTSLGQYGPRDPNRPREAMPQEQKEPWVAVLQRVTELDGSVMETLATLAQTPMVQRPAALEQGLETIQDRLAALREARAAGSAAWEEKTEALTGRYPGIEPTALTSADLRARDPEFGGLADALLELAARHSLMGDAEQRFLEVFGPAIREGLEPAVREPAPKRQPRGEEEERSNGQTASTAGPAPVGRGPGMVAHPRPGNPKGRPWLGHPEAAPPAGARQAVLDAGARRLADAYHHYKTLTYPLEWFAQKNGSPIPAGTEVPPIQDFGGPAELPQHRKVQWHRTLQRVADYDWAIMEFLPRAAQTPKGQLASVLDQGLRIIRDKGLQMEAELKACDQEYRKALAAFRARFPLIDVDDPGASGLKPGDPGHGLMLELREEVASHAARIQFMNAANKRYVEVFEPAIRDLTWKRRPRGKETGRRPERTVTAVAVPDGRGQVKKIIFTLGKGKGGAPTRAQGFNDEL